MGTSIWYVNPPVTLKRRSRSPKPNQVLSFVQIIYPGKYGGVQSTGSRDVVGTRIFHVNADTDAGSNGIRTKTKMSPPLWWGDIKISNGFDVIERTRVCGRNGNFQCSKSNNSKSMQTRVTVPMRCTSSDGA